MCAGAGPSTSATGPISPTQTTTAASPTSSAASGTAGANIFTGQQIFLVWFVLQVFINLCNHESMYHMYVIINFAVQ